MEESIKSGCLELIALGAAGCTLLAAAVLSVPFITAYGVCSIREYVNSLKGHFDNRNFRDKYQECANPWDSLREAQNARLEEEEIFS